jgi:hypothetical protein
MRLFLFVALFTLATASAYAADPKPVYKWMAANEYYMIMPTAQTLNISGGGSESVKPWGFGFRAVGNNETISKTGGLQFQSIKVDNPHTGKDTFYLFDLLLGMEFMTPKVQGKPLRFTAQAFADLGLSNTTLYAAPMISAGFLYTTKELTDTPTGLTFDIFYRPIDLDLDNVGGGKAGTLKPALGIKIGYIFEGFWTIKEKSKE